MGFLSAGATWRMLMDLVRSGATTETSLATILATDTMVVVSEDPVVGLEDPMVGLEDPMIIMMGSDTEPVDLGKQKRINKDCLFSDMFDKYCIRKSKYSTHN